MNDLCLMVRVAGPPAARTKCKRRRTVSQTPGAVCNADFGDLSRRRASLCVRAGRRGAPRERGVDRPRGARAGCSLLLVVAQSAEIGELERSQQGHDLLGLQVVVV